MSNGLKNLVAIVAEPGDGNGAMASALAGQAEMEVESFGSRDGLVSRLKKGRADILYLDLALAKPSGAEFVNMLRSQEELGGLGIVLAGARESLDGLGSLAYAGDVEFVVLPSTPEELRARGRAISRRMASQAPWRSPLRRTERRAPPGAGPLEQISADIAGVLPFGMALVDSGMNIYFANQTLCTMLGQTRAQLVGRNLFDLFAATLFKDGRVTPALDKVRETGQPQSVTAVAWSPEGREPRLLNVAWRPVGSSGRENPTYLFTMEDATDRHRAATRADEEIRRLTAMTDASSAGLALVGPDRNMAWVNRAAREWLGAVTGRSARDALPGMATISNGDPVALAIEKSEPSVFHWTFKAPNLPRKTFKVETAPFKPKADGPAHALVLLQDITTEAGRLEQRQLISQLVAATLEELDLDHQLHLVLTGVTAGHALGFNRAFLFMIDRSRNALTGRMGVGPASWEEARRIWAELSGSTLNFLLARVRDFNKESLPLFHAIKDLAYPLSGEQADQEILTRCIHEKSLILVRDAREDPRVSKDFRFRFGANEFVVVPLIARGEPMGVILADNLYSGSPIMLEQVELLAAFASPAALAIAGAATLEQKVKALEDLKAAQKALIAAEKLAVIGRLASHVAHEIRNPLVTIGGFARSILKRPERADRNRQAAQIIAEEVERLEDILSGVMDFTRPARPVMVEMRVNELIHHVIDPLRQELETKNIPVKLDLAENLPIIQADQKQIQQVLLNLIKNAVDAMPRGGTLAVRTESAAGEVVIQFRDAGVGMTEDVQANIFSPFYTTKSGGTGLGLAVSLKIVEDHGGAIRVWSEPGQGTEMTVALKVRPLPREGAAAVK
jgi:PAS domain S-box-containing protein